MGQAPRDENRIATLLGTSNADGTTPVTIYADPTTHRLLVDLPGGSGTVTSVSVVSANGFAGSVATATTTPAITLSTTITGVLKGNGTAMSAASAGTDYVAPGAITTSGLTQSTARILGRTTASTGAVEEITVGTGLTLSAGSLVATGVAASIVVGTTTITSGTTTRVLYDNAGTLGEYVTTSAATASAVVIRDASANVYFNNCISNATTTASAAGTTVLTVASSRIQRLTGATTQTYQLPDATTLSLGPWFAFDNNSSGALTITDAGANTLYTVPAGGYVQVSVTSIGTANGGWDFHPFAPATATWGSGTTGLVFNTALSTSSQIIAGASSATAPTFIPQRGASTTGFGGDGTNLFATIGGTAYLKIASGSISPNANDATALGTTTLGFSDAHFATGGTLNWANGNAVITHSSAVLEVTTGDLRVTTAGTNAASVATLAGTQTFTNKRRTRRLTTTNAPGATPTTNTDNVDVMNFTGLATAITSMTTNLSGTPVDGDLLEFRFTDDGTARGITWGASFAATTIALPTTTVISTMLRVGFEYSGSTWKCIATA